MFHCANYWKQVVPMKIRLQFSCSLHSRGEEVETDNKPTNKEMNEIIFVL